jgi:hypothetical protein
MKKTLKLKTKIPECFVQELNDKLILKDSDPVLNLSAWDSFSVEERNKHHVLLSFHSINFFNWINGVIKNLSSCEEEAILIWRLNNKFILKIYFNKEYYENEIKIYNLIKNARKDSQYFLLIESFKKHTPKFISSFECDCFSAMIREYIDSNDEINNEDIEMFKNKYESTLFQEINFNRNHFIVNSTILKCINFSRFKLKKMTPSNQIENIPELTIEVFGFLRGLKIYIPFLECVHSDDFLYNIISTKNHPSDIQGNYFGIQMKGKIVNWINGIINSSWTQQVNDINQKFIRWILNNESVFFFVDKKDFEMKKRYYGKKIVSSHSDDKINQYGLHVKF